METTIKNCLTNDFKRRNTLLQESLRPEKISYNICQEYPIVLNEKNSKYSYCLYNKDALIAHCNLWPREIISNNNTEISKVGLIGNVATSLTYRGQGMMRALFRKIERIAKKQKIDCIFLWSELNDFYEKLGFSTVSQELRLLLPCNPTWRNSDHDFDILLSSQLTDQEARRLFRSISELRPSIPHTVSRDYSSFLKLIKIPDMHICLHYDKQQKIDFFSFIGKGYDMQGVIHEWGFRDISILKMFLGELSHISELTEILLLSPVETPESDLLKAISISYECFPMALGKSLTNEPITQINWAQNSFIWGLDSI